MTKPTKDMSLFEYTLSTILIDSPPRDYWLSRIMLAQIVFVLFIIAVMVGSIFYQLTISVIGIWNEIND